MLNGKPVMNGEAARLANLPFVRVHCDPSKATPDNPSGICIGTNMPQASAGNGFSAIKMLSEGIFQLSCILESQPKVSSSVVLSDGRPAPLPETTGE